jgi:hypothetical protein
LPSAGELGPGVPIADFGRENPCSAPATKSLVAAGRKLFLYQRFGFKGDPRARCTVSGGIYGVDPQTGNLSARAAGEYYFSHIVPNLDGSLLFGIASTGAGSRLVKPDSNDARVRSERNLGTGLWRIAVVPFSSSPADIRIAGMTQ